MIPYKSLTIISLLSIMVSTPVLASTPFIPYADLTINAHWDSTYQDMEPMDLNEISQATGIKSYHLAFITDAGNCQPAWGAQSSYAINWGSHLIDKLRANQISFMISLGGATGNDLSKACNDGQLLQAYEQIITAYQPMGLDFDIENGSADVNKVMRTLEKIQANHPNLKISFTLPVLPEGLIASGKDIINEAKRSKLNYSINIMTMDYGPAYQNDMGEYAISAATQVFHFLKTSYPEKSDESLWQMIEVTPMIGVNDVNVESFTLENVDTLRRFADQKQLKSLAYWSIARDKPCADQWASPICSGKNLQSVPYEFAKRFLK